MFPHPKPLSIVVRPDDHTHKEQLSPDDIGLGSTPESGSLHRIVVLHRGVPGRHGLQPLDTTTALMELIEQSSSLASLDAPLTTLLEVMDATGGVLALEYDEITDHVDELIGLLDEVTEPTRQPGTGSSPSATRARLRVSRPTWPPVTPGSIASRGPTPSSWAPTWWCSSRREPCACRSSPPRCGCASTNRARSRSS